MTYRPAFVSEREAAHIWPGGQIDDAHWEDCSWTSALMLSNASSKGRWPATLAEAEAARATVMGPVGGTTIGQLVTGMQLRWKFTGRRLNSDATSFDLFWANLLPGTGAVVMGRLGGLPDGHRLRRWQPLYIGGHAIYAQREDSTDRVWWMDPLAVTGYVGEYASKADLAAYYNAFRAPGSGNALAPVWTEPAGDDLNLTHDIPVALCDVAPGTDVIDAATGKVVIPGWAGGSGIGLYSIGGGNAALRVDLGSGGSDLRVCYVDPAKTSNVRLKDAPPPSGDYDTGYAAAKQAATAAVEAI